jgi:hypothetical protein
MDKPDKIGELFNIPPQEILPAVHESTEIITDVEEISDEQQFQHDFDLARESLLNAMEFSKAAMDTLKVIADGTQHPKAFEVIATLIDKNVTVSKELLELHKKKKEMIGEGPKSQTINNNLILSTTDLLKMIKGE